MEVEVRQVATASGSIRSRSLERSECQKAHRKKATLGRDSFGETGSFGVGHETVVCARTTKPRGSLGVVAIDVVRLAPVSVPPESGPPGVTDSTRLQVFFQWPLCAGALAPLRAGCARTKPALPLTAEPSGAAEES
jgi:hypothetical protein